MKQCLTEAKHEAEKRLADPTNPPWVRRACENLVAAINPILEMIETPCVVIDGLTRTENSQELESHPASDLRLKEKALPKDTARLHQVETPGLSPK